MSAQNVYHVRKWHRWQRASITSVARARRSRRERNESDVGILDDYSMTFVCISTSLERDLCSALSRDESLGKLIDAYLLRLLQYVARSSGVRGEIHLPPRMWGPTIFARPWDTVSASKGKRILAAFESVKIVLPGPAILPEWLDRMDSKSRNASRDAENACSAPSGTASASVSESPPSPLPGAGSSNGKGMRKRDWTRLGRCLRYHAVVNRSAPASRLGKLLREGGLSEQSALDALAKYAVPTKNLTNFERNG